MEFEVVTAGDRPDLDQQAAAAFRQRWPEFIFHDPVPPRYLARVGEYFAAYDILLLADGRVVAGGWGVPFAYSGELDDLPQGYDSCLVRAVEDHEGSRTATALSIMAAAVDPDHDGRGLAGQVLSSLVERARDAGLESVFAPLRPTWKSRYPHVAMADYATWSRPDGLHVDPWIRTHQRMGARIVGAAPDSMVIPGTVAQWEEWAGMAFPVTGEYVVPDALNMVHVDRENDEAVYREENLWVRHR